MQIKKNKGIYLIPNLLTTWNVFCGFYSIIASINGRFYHAAVAIIIAMLIDGFDGRIARLTHSESDFGFNYDSLADIISFGMAPGLLIYLWVLKPFGRIGWMAAFLFVICGALRLARFNSQSSSSGDCDFVGLPIPAAGGVIASFVIMTKDIFFTNKTEPLLMVCVVYILAFLMVSNIKYKSLKKLEVTKKKTFNILIFFVLLIYIIAVIPQIMLFVITTFYAVSGPVVKLLSYVKTDTAIKEIGIEE